MSVVLSKLSPLYRKTKSLKTAYLLLLTATYYFLQTTLLWFLQSPLLIGAAVFPVSRLTLRRCLL